MFDKLVDLFIQFVRIFQFATIIKAYQAGVRLRFGKFHAALKPGVHFFLPFWIDDVLWENVVTETMRVKPQSLTTKDGVAVVISAVITFHIENVRTFLLDVEGRNNVIEDSSYGVIADFVMKRTWDELVGIEDLGNELAKKVRNQAKKYGVAVENVQLVDFQRCRSVRVILGPLRDHL